MNGRQLHRGLTRVLSLAMCVIGAALVVEAVVEGNPVLALLGALFFAAGAGRIYIQTRRQPRA
jgi:drug/metabolite transporter (DMT)-like permease